MTAPTCQVEVWVLVDEDGGYVVAKTPEDAKDNYEAEFSATDCVGFRLIQLSLTVPQPVHIEASGVITEQDGPVALTVS